MTESDKFNSWFSQEQPEPGRTVDGLSAESDVDYDGGYATHAGAGEFSGPGHRRETRRRSAAGCLAALVALAVICGAAFFGATRLIDWAKENFSNPADYPGPGTGKVLFEVKSGDTSEDMADGLVAKDVVESWQAFVDAARADPQSSTIQVGWYQLKRKMNSADALEILINPKNIITTTVTIPEGLRVDEIVARLAKGTGFSQAEFTKVLGAPKSFGLPAYAGGNPEGYLFPATYDFKPTDQPVDMLSRMVDRYRQALGDNNIEQVAANLGPGYTPEQIMTVASLLESEANNNDDMTTMSRAIYNRLELDNGGGTFGYLQIDASVLYALDSRDPGVLIEPLAELTDSAYNTYRYPGLPPGPIGAPGEAAIQAALHPSDGPWLYWVTVDCDGTTLFSSTLAEHTSHTAVSDCS